MSMGAIDPLEMPAPIAAEAAERPRWVERPASQPAPSTVQRVRWVDVSCRVLDIVVAAVALVVLLPLLAMIALVIRAESAGSPFFTQERVGRNQRRFMIHKFRTMTAGASHDRHREFVQGLLAGKQPEATDGNLRFKMTADDRITRVGRFLRRSSLDELPQLWDVIRGDMSLVGPRPPIHYEVEHYPAPHWFTRFDVKPGLTGLWQVSGRSDLTLEQMIALDTEYVRRRSLWLNVWILARTVPAVLASRGAV